MNEREIAGGCYCGAHGISVRLPVAGVLNCHCSICRRLSGAGYTTWVAVPARQFSLRSTDRQLAEFQVTANTKRHFCSVCGTAVYSTDRRYPDIVGIARGVLEDDAGLAPALHAFYDSKASWVSIADDLPCRGGSSGMEPLRE